MKLVIISHTPHYQKEGLISAWGSTVREIDQLATLFEEVVHLAPLYPGQPPQSAIPYSNPRVKLLSVNPAGGETFTDKLSIVRQVPNWMNTMHRELAQADVVHVRCPAGISLVGLLAVRLWARNKPCWVKYAGDWGAVKRQPLSYRLQRVWLKNNQHNWVVTVNGHWKNQERHIISFYNPSYSQAEYQLHREKALSKSLTSPLNLLFVGRLETAKGFDRIIEIARELDKKDVKFSIDVIGDGPEREKFRNMLQTAGLADRVIFHGWMARLEIDRFYEKAHIILLPSTASEGWPKVLSESMSFGVVPIASRVGSIPEILDLAMVGLSLPPVNIQDYVNGILQYVSDSDLWKRESLAGVEFAENFSYEHYLENVRSIFKKFFKLDLMDA